jgi:hypothetical protein
LTTSLSPSLIEDFITFSLKPYLGNWGKKGKKRENNKNNKRKKSRSVQKKKTK